MESIGSCTTSSQLPEYFTWSYLTVYLGILVAFSFFGAITLLNTHNVKLNVPLRYNQADKLSTIIGADIRDSKKPTEQPDQGDTNDIIVFKDQTSTDIDANNEDNLTPFEIVCCLIYLGLSDLLVS